MPAVNTPTIALADNGNGTGAVATVGNSTGGATNTIFAAQWAGGFVPQAYASYGSRIGNGTVSLALGLGYWFVYAASTLAGSDGAVSLVKGLRVTAGQEAIFDQCLDAIVAKIQALSLPAPWQTIDVVRRKFPWKRSLILPDIQAGIFVTPLNDRFVQVTNQADDWGEAIQITAAQATNLDLENGLPADLLCRQQLVDAFLPVHGQAPLSGVDSVYNIVIEPGPIIDPGAFQQNFDVSAIVARCLVRRTRGLT
ncbi:MAG: hypothetical protein L0211_09175 [Planctomycetaceae bacterium]|nr:hypothetical protein [Planctomycetaceae bacterium]